MWIGSAASTLRSVSTICVPPAAPSVFSSISRSQKSSGSASSMGFRFPNRLRCQPWRGKYHVVCPSISWTLHKFRTLNSPCPAGRPRGRPSGIRLRLVHPSEDRTSYSSHPRPAPHLLSSKNAPCPRAPPMKKLLALNRSEIAIRILRAANELALRTVAVYSKEDRLALHRFKADEAYLIGEGKGPVEAYLDVEGIVALAKEKGVDAIHPGYGFLSENPALPRACERAGITFVGPSAGLLDLLGDKTAARRLAQQAGIRCVPGSEEAVTNAKQAAKMAGEVGYPLMVKAAFGGGGRGMRVVDKPEDFAGKLDEARRESAAAFGNDAVFLERFVRRAKHIEVQILGDHHGNILHLYERDCSVQRRHQKVVEVAPAVSLAPAIRAALADAAVTLARAAGYRNAGTVEFLVDGDTGEWFFIEVNPRIQVEHTVTEMVTGIDLVRCQIQIAQGLDLHGPEMNLPPQDRVPLYGYAMQCRITTEDPANGFVPDYGKIHTYRSPAGFGIRLDGGSAYSGAVITPFYDSLLVKTTAWGREFPHACQRMDRCLREFRVRGVKTNIPFLENVVNHPDFQAGNVTTRWLEETPALFKFAARQDRATKLLGYLADVIVNGNPQVAGKPPPTPIRPPPP